MTRTRQKLIKVWAKFPENATNQEVAEYVTGALEEMGGCRNPDEDPMFDSLSVTAVQIGGTKWTNSDPRG